MTQKQKRERFVTSKGIAIWPRLNQPDTKFVADGQFTCKLAFAGDDAANNKLVKKLTAIRDEAFKQYLSENPKFKKVAKVVDFFHPELDEEGDETGRITMNFKMNHKIKAKKTGKVYTLWPTILNAKKVVLKNAPNIGGGSELKVSFEVNPYFNAKDKEFGLSLRLVAVQIISLVEFGTSASAAKDFEDEDGYDGEGAEESGDDEDDSDEDADDEDGGKEDGDGDY